MTVAHFFDTETRMATMRNLACLKNLVSKTSQLIPAVDGMLTFLCCAAHDYTSAQAITSYAVIFFSEELLTRAPEPIIQTVAIHESIHLRFGSELRRALAQEHPDVVRLLHKSIIPDWLNGRLEIRPDTDYILHKGWDLLYDGWIGPLAVQPQKAKDAVNRYFASLKRGLVFLEGGEIFAVPPLAADQLQTVEISMEDAYGNSPEETAAKITTGYELLEYLTDCLRAAMSAEMSLDLWILEEGFANYVSTSLTGVSLDELQRWAPQDAEKIEIARRMGASRTSIGQLLQSIETYSDLVAFCKETGVLTRA